MYYDKLIHSGYTTFKLLKSCSFLVFFALISFNSQATNYYFSSSSGNDSYSSTQAQSPSTPWRTIAKLNSFFGNIAAGDNIYFNRGDVFYGSIVMTKSGTNGRLITIGAYGSGNKPVISGLTTLSSWSSVGSGIYQAAAPGVKNSVNLVTLNGVPQGVGRYPNLTAANGGYLTYESYGTNYIADREIGSTNWTGAEVVIRKQHYLMEKCKITGQSGSVINYTTTPTINPLNNNNPVPGSGTNGFGYFIQRDVRTLDLMGEWFFNTSTKYMQMYFGGNSPSSYNIQVSTLDTLINIGTRSYININNIAFEGGNVAGIYSANGGNITIQSCDMKNIGGKGVFIFNCPNLLVDGVTTNNMMVGAIDATSRHANNTVVRNCTIANTAMIAGMGSFWDDNDCKAISVQVNTGATIENNSVDHTGFVGIQFQGNNILVQNNFVNYFDIVKDDGGGIYTYQSGTDASPGQSYTNRVIRNNIVMNGIGVSAGTTGDIDVDGIFLDGRTTNVEILNNTLANIGMNGIYTNNSVNVNMHGNTCFNNGNASLCISRYYWGSNKNVRITQNIFYPKYKDQMNFAYGNSGVNSPVTTTIAQSMADIGYIDSNYYAISNPAGGFNYIYAQNQGGSWIYPPQLTYDGWKLFTGHDRYSKLPAKTTTDPDNQLRFEYNPTTSSKNVNLGANYMGVDGTVYNGSITLDPFTSKILVYNGAATNPPPVSGLRASASVPPISCFGSNTTITVTGSGGTAPYTGIGSYSVNAGKGSLKISASIPVPLAYTLIYAPIGAVSSAKTYILRFSTLGTSNGGSLRASIRQAGSPYAYITPTQSRTFGTSRVDHEFVFTAPGTQTGASFLIELLQTSGTTYFDNIAFFEATTAGALISNNLFTNGQFESDISGVSTWSAISNHGAEFDASGKLTNTYYYPVKDATGAISTATAKVTQPDSPLQSFSSAGTVTSTGGTTSIVVTATGGTAPYTGTGTYDGYKVGSYSFTVRDANGCTSVTSVTVTQNGGTNPPPPPPPPSSSLTATASVPAISCFGGSVIATVRASGGSTPYYGIGSYNVDAGSGTLKISVPVPIPLTYTLLYAPIGAVSSSRTYVLRFTTRGTTSRGSLRASLRLSGAPYTTITPTQTRSFGVESVSHEFIFSSPPSQSGTSFLIELLQTSGTTYFDNIAFFAATPAGVPNSDNLFSNGQFENSISGITTWSAIKNHVASLDQTSAIRNTYYIPVKDATGAITIATANVSQPSLPLVASGSVANFNGTTATIIVAGSGGTAPYSGVGNYRSYYPGTYNFTVKDANGCTAVATVTVRQNGSARIAGNGSISGKLLDSVAINQPTALKVSSYPNPTSTEFGVMVNGGTNEAVSIIASSIDGKIVYKAQGTSNKRYTFGNELQSGVYIIKVIQGQTLQTLKVVKAK